SYQLIIQGEVVGAHDGRAIPVGTKANDRQSVTARLEERRRRSQRKGVEVDIGSALVQSDLWTPTDRLHSSAGLLARLAPRSPVVRSNRPHFDPLVYECERCD